MTSASFLAPLVNSLLEARRSRLAMSGIVSEGVAGRRLWPGMIQLNVIYWKAQKWLRLCRHGGGSGDFDLIQPE